MEKARTVPDTYPLTLNSLLSACNQKTSREPLMEIDSADAAAALAELTKLALVFEAPASRVTRYSHNVQRGFGLDEPAAVVLGLLMLRGPQTPAELRLNAERWYKFADPPASSLCCKPCSNAVRMVARLMSRCCRVLLVRARRVGCICSAASRK